MCDIGMWRREKALEAGTIEALRREVRKLLGKLQEETLRQNELKELSTTLQVRRGGGGGGGERLIKDLQRKANSLSRDTRQASALGLEGGPPPLKNCS